MNEQPFNMNYAQGNGQGPMMPKPENNLILAIFTTICCCLPIGIYAIIKANDVNNLYVMGRYQEAQLAAAEAKKWSIIGIVVGAVLSIIYGISMTALGFMGNMGNL